MIENSSNVRMGSYYTHPHKHEITKCLHETAESSMKVGAAASAGMGMKAQQQKKGVQQSMSFRDFLFGGIRNLFDRAAGFWRRLGEEEEGQEKKAAPGNGKAPGTILSDRPDGVRGQENAVVAGLDGRNGTFGPDGEKAAAAVLATAAIKPEEKREESRGETERRVGNVEGAISGGLKKDQDGISGFLQKFSGVPARAKQFLKKEKQDEQSLAENNTDLGTGDSSFLMDSYNRMGEYSTLAKNRSLDSSFRARG